MTDEFFALKEPHYDYLTQVYERLTIENYIKELIAQDIPFSFALIDIDNFKNVNDGYGHNTGDEIIKTMAQAIKNALKDTGIVGRFGGDEFMIVLKNKTEYDEIWQICHNLFSKVTGTEIPSAPGLYLTLTLGLSRYKIDADNYEDLFETADKALYRGKTKGRNCFIIYLAEKHKDIKLLSTKDAGQNSMQRHTDIFRTLNSSNTLSNGIKSLFKNLSSMLMIDHICIQSEGKLYFSQIYSLSKTKEFKAVSEDNIKKNMNSLNRIFYYNDISQLRKIHGKSFEEECRSQNIHSIFYAEIRYRETLYGYLRADSTTTMRIWQYTDMNLLITAANTIALKLHYENKTIESLEN